MTSVDVMLPAFNLDPVLKQLLNDPATVGWSPERLKRAVLHYRRFLALKQADLTLEIVPGKDADVVWHRHILNTEMYRNHCNEFFGLYLDHCPGQATDEQI